MSSSLVPPSPDDVMVIREVTPNVVTFSVPFSRYGLLPVGGRGTVVRLSSGALAVFSPVALTEAAKAKVAALGGDVRYIVAPDMEHHLFLSEWAAAYPAAKLVGPAGLPEKRAQAAASDPRIGTRRFDVVVTRQAVADGLSIGDDFDRDFDLEYVYAHPNRELVFLYKPDRVLIQADLLPNMPPEEQYLRAPADEKPEHSLLARFAYPFMSTREDAIFMKRFLWYVVSLDDRSAFNESVARIAAWDFDTIVPCHGETIVGGAKEVFERVFGWHL